MCNLKQNQVLIYSISGNHWMEANCPPQLFFPFFRLVNLKKERRLPCQSLSVFLGTSFSSLSKLKSFLWRTLKKSNLVVNSEDRVPVLKFLPSWGIGESQAQ